MNVTFNLPPLLRDSRLLVFLFISFRLMALLAHQPLLQTTIKDNYRLLEPNGADVTERGITSTGDFWYYYGLIRFSDKGLLPYRDYWYEFPPVFPAISLTVYSLVGNRDGTFGSYTAYANFLTVIMILFDAGNLILLRRLATRLYNVGTGIALSWVYAALGISFLHVFWNFEPLVAFAVLLAVYFMVHERAMRGALAIAFGACIKLFPVILLAAVWRFRPPLLALRQSIIVLAITGAVFLGMVAMGGPLGSASLYVQFNKASYQTVWALLDGNHRTGLLDPDHLNPEGAYRLQGNPAVVPWWLRGIVFGAIGLFIYMRARRRDEIAVVAFTLITIVIFFLWSQGWSPQWQVTLFPLILLCMPNASGVLFCVTLAFVGLAEFPTLFARGIDPATAQFTPQVFPIFAALVILRTLMLALLAFGLYRMLRITVPRKTSATPPVEAKPALEPS